MVYKTKITRLFFVAWLLLFSSCKDRCYTADEFDSYDFQIESNPTADGVKGSYDESTGGQSAEWHDTGLVSNGEQFVIAISGAWVPWSNGATFTDKSVSNLERCNFCAIKNADPAPNCVCYSDQEPEDEFAKDCTSDKIDDPNLCTCTNNVIYGVPTDYGFYHRNLNYYEKNGTVKNANQQSTCKYDRGMNLYIGLFGSKGVVTPKRQYHLFSPDETICPVDEDANGNCLNDDGVDVTRYIYRSPNERIFMKDDGARNEGTDTDTSDDTYHSANEVVKLIIADNYYTDNYGKYNVSIWKGVGYTADSDDKGILEFLVRLVEDVLLGEPDDDGVRQKGVIEFFYNSIIQDSIFILTLRAMLSLYICFYGIATLMGVAEINRKELMNRVLKISLIMFFTSASSWKYYNQFIVVFFYDGMNYLVSLFTSLSTEVPGVENTPQLVQATISTSGMVTSNATRFGYIDTVIMMLLSEAVAAKIFGLIFADMLGILYILIIYSLIAGFIIIMLFAASVYAINIMKMVFVLSIGPIFICFTLFSHTSGFFKNWIGYLGARALEIVMMFFILYIFVIMINNAFNTMLYYETCVESFGIAGFTVIKILRSDVSRSVLDWFSQFISIGALIFMMKLVLDKIPAVAGRLISIGGVDNRSAATGTNFGQSSFDIAKGAIFGNGGKNDMGGLVGLVKGGLSRASIPAAVALSAAGSGAMMAARASGVAGAISKVTDMIPFNNPRAMYRNSIIDAEIKAAQKKAAAEGKTGKAADQFVRSEVMKALNNKSLSPDAAKLFNVDSDKRTMLLSGVNIDSIQQRLDQKLIHEPLQKAIKDEIKRIKASDNPLIGKDLRQAAAEFGKSWAEKNLHVGASDVKAYLSDKPDSSRNLFDRKLKSMIESSSRYSSSDAAKASSKNDGFKDQYMKSLADDQMKMDERRAQARKGINTRVAREITGVSSVAGAVGAAIRKTAGIVPAAGNMALDAARALTRSESVNPTLAAKNFARELDNIDQDKFKSQAQSIRELASGTAQSLNPFNYSSTMKSAAQTADNARRMLGNKMANIARGKDDKKEFKPTNIFSTAKSDINNSIRQYLKTPPSKRAKDKELSERENRRRDKDHDKQEKSKREIAQKKLREMSMSDRELNKEIKNIKFMEARGKLEDAREAKKQLISKLSADLIEFSGSGEARFKQSDLTVYERLAKLDHAQQQLGIKGFNAKDVASEAVRVGFEEREKKISDIISDKNYLFNDKARAQLESHMQDVRQLGNGLFFDDHVGENGSRATDEIAAKLLKQIEATLVGISSQELQKPSILKTAELASESVITPTQGLKEFENEAAKDRKTNEESEQIRDKLQGLESSYEKAKKEMAEKDEAKKIKEEEDAKKLEELKINHSKKKTKEEEDEEVKKKDNSVPEITSENITQTVVRQDINRDLTPEEQIEFSKKVVTELYEVLGDPEKMREITESLDGRAAVIDKIIERIDAEFEAYDKKKAEGSLTGDDQERMAQIIEKLTKDMEDLIFVKTSVAVEEFKEDRKLSEVELQERRDEMVKKSEEISQYVGMEKDSVSALIPTSFEVQFGSSITDALLKESDVLLKAGNPFLGVPDVDPNKALEASKLALQSDLRQGELKLKIKNLNKKVKEFELQQAKDANDVSKADRIKRELDEIESDISNIETHNGKITASLAS